MTTKYSAKIVEVRVRTGQREQPLDSGAGEGRGNKAVTIWRGSGSASTDSTRRSRSYTYTGEQQSFVIPVGTLVITTGNITVKFNSLSVGRVLALTLREDVEPTVISVNLLEG